MTLRSKPGHHLIGSLNSAPGHVIAAVGRFAVFIRVTSITARDVLRLETGAATHYSGRMTELLRLRRQHLGEIKIDQLSSRPGTHHRLA
jgi:hypothetical protein